MNKYILARFFGFNVFHSIFVTELLLSIITVNSSWTILIHLTSKDVCRGQIDKAAIIALNASEIVGHNMKYWLSI